MLPHNRPALTTAMKGPMLWLPPSYPIYPKMPSASSKGLVDAFGLQNVLNGLACICSGKADHIESNWLANHWEKAAVHLMNAADHSAVKVLS
jgi:hypothetical protein